MYAICHTQILHDMIEYDKKRTCQTIYLDMGAYLTILLPSFIRTSTMRRDYMIECFMYNIK